MAELKVKDVSVRFGGIQAVSDVNLQILSGKVTGLIGPNGAGKTTLFNVITGLQAPTHGQVLLDGRDLTNLAPHRRARLGLARTFQRLELFGTLSALENVQMALETRGSVPALTGRPSWRSQSGKAGGAHDLLARVGVVHVADEPADLLPTGLARLVELARALATSPSVLLLDEPSAGLDDNESAELGAVLEDLASNGMAVLLVEHDMGLVMSVCRHVAVMDGGFVIAEGEPAQIQADRAVQEAYLGAAEPGATGLSNGARAPGDEELAKLPPPNRDELVNAPRPEQNPASSVDPTSRPTDFAEGSPMLELRDIHAGYGRIEVVRGVSLSVRAGSVLALLGPNGAGKSTLMKVVSGQLAPMSGTVLIDGNDVTGLPGERLVRRGMCAVPEGRSVFPNLTVAENLRMYSYCRKGLHSHDLEEQSYERFPVLRDRRRQLAGRLSGGEQQALALARALCSGARVLLIDEMSMGLAPLIVADLYQRVQRLVTEEDVAVVLVEQFAKTALALADEAAIMVNGRIVRHGSPSEMETELLRSYMGEAAV